MTFTIAEGNCCKDVHMASGVPSTAELNLNTNSQDFLQGLIPNISLDLFTDLSGVVSPTLNCLFATGSKICSALRNDPARVAGIMLSIYNFYLRTKECQSYHSLAVGFIDMLNNIFRFDQYPVALKSIQTTVHLYFQRMQEYFIKKESAEKAVNEFWKALDLTNGRNFMNLAWDLASISGTCFMIHDTLKSGLEETSVGELLKSINTHLMDPASEVRKGVKKVSEIVARVIDFFLLNVPFILRGEFKKICWNLPAPVKFENDYSNFISVYQKSREDPLYLEKENITKVNLRDQAKTLMERAQIEMANTTQPTIRRTYVEYHLNLSKIHTYFVNALNPHNTKPEPMTLSIAGPAGSGKSMLARSIGKTMQIVAGREANDDLIVNTGGDPKFSFLNGDTEVVINEDFANDRSEPIESKRVLDPCNVTMEVIPKANVEEKGKHKYGNIGNLFTTNDEDIGIDLIKTCSSDSMVRRFGLILVTNVKPEYCKSGTKVLDRNHPALRDGKFNPDIYDIEIRQPKYVGVKGRGKRRVRYLVYELVEDWRLERTSDLQSAMVFLRKHFEKVWAMNVQRHAESLKEDNTCPKCALHKSICVCKYLEPVEEEIEKSSGSDESSEEQTKCSDDRSHSSGYEFSDPEIEAISHEDGVDDDESSQEDTLPKLVLREQSFLDEGYKANSEVDDVKSESLKFVKDSVEAVSNDYMPRKLYSSFAGSIAEKYMLFDSYIIDECDSLLSAFTRMKIQYLMMKLRVSMVNDFYLRFRHYCSGGILYLLFAVFIPQLTYIIFFYYLWRLEMSHRTRLGLCSHLVLTYFNPSLGSLFIGLCLPFLVFALERQKIMKVEYERFRARRIGMRQFYFGRQVILAGAFASAVIPAILGVKILINYFSTNAEGTVDVAEEPYLPKFKPTNNDRISKYYFEPDVEHKARSGSHSEAVKFIGKKIVVVTVTRKDYYSRVIGIPMGSEILVPYHLFPKDGKFDITVSGDPTRRTSSYVSRNMTCKDLVRLVDRSGTGVDAALVNVPNMPIQPNLLKFFAEGELPVNSPSIEIFKEDDGVVKYIDTRARTAGLMNPGTYTTQHGRYIGYPRYVVDNKTVSSKEGMCGSPVVSDNANCIIGFHISGSESKRWYALKLTKDMIVSAREKLKAESARFVAHPAPLNFYMKNNMLNLQFKDTQEQHVVEEIGEECSPLEKIGELYRDGNLYCDRAEKHYFPNNNPGLEEAFGPRESYPPMEPNGEEQINATLKKLHTPKFDVPVDLVDKAAKDYLDTDYMGVDFQQIVDDLKEEHGPEFFTVRSLEEALQGDKTGIVRGVNNGSSAGVCYGGKKTAHYDMEVEGDPLEIRKVKDYIVKDVETQETRWRQGEGTIDGFKRCSKTNELRPEVKAKTTTRSFYGNDLVFFANMMRGCVSLKHVLRASQELSECFVGVTAQGKDWRRLLQFISRGGKFKNFICGDFSGYDTQLPKVLLDKAANIVIELARRGGMSESDLEFLRGALSSVVSPVLFWQGHVLRAANGQPSGQPLTVEINSIINSLLMRMAFFVVIAEDYPEFKDLSFRDLVALATYGDDNLMGVDDRIPMFNHTRVQSIFASWGIKYTMADKEADSVPYQTQEEISFLKRGFHFNRELDSVVAPIENQSIVKAFYYWVRPKNTPLNFQAQFGALVDSQVREACLHGREYYNDFCKSIELLAEKSVEQKEEFHIKFKHYYLPSYDEMVVELYDAYHDKPLVDIPDFDSQVDQATNNSSV